MDDLVQRKELAAFLRSRRETVQPEQVGIRGAQRRRTPGLRREEVAQLASVSLTWYTWLEQGREISVSRKVIDSLANALRLGLVERAHLYVLSGLPDPPSTEAPPPDELLRLANTLDPHPAAVLDVWWNIRAFNRSFDQLLGGLNSVAPQRRNMLSLSFREVLDRRLVDNWSVVVAEMVGQLRVRLAREPHDPGGAAVRDQLLADSPEFAELWHQHPVSQFGPSIVTFHHPSEGQLRLRFVKLSTADDARHEIAVYLPAEDSSALLTGFVIPSE